MKETIRQIEERIINQFNDEQGEIRHHIHHYGKSHLASYHGDLVFYPIAHGGDPLYSTSHKQAMIALDEYIKDYLFKRCNRMQANKKRKA